MNFQKMIQDAQKAQKQLKQKLDEFDNQEFDYDFKNLVNIKINGALKVLDIKINSSIIDSSDPDTLQDVIIEAINKAIIETTDKKNQLANSVIPGLNGLL